MLRVHCLMPRLRLSLDSAAHSAQFRVVYGQSCDGVLVLIFLFIFCCLRLSVEPYVCKAVLYHWIVYPASYYYIIHQVCFIFLRRKRLSQVSAVQGKFHQSYHFPEAMREKNSKTCFCVRIGQCVGKWWEGRFLGVLSLRDCHCHGREEF